MRYSSIEIKQNSLQHLWRQMCSVLGSKEAKLLVQAGSELNQFLPKLKLYLWLNPELKLLAFMGEGLKKGWQKREVRR